jgi:hypothetical protein
MPNITLKERFIKEFIHTKSILGMGEVHATGESVWQFIEQAIIQAENSKVEEIEGIIDVVLGYIGNEKEYKAAKNRWDILKVELLHQPKENKKDEDYIERTNKLILKHPDRYEDMAEKYANGEGGTGKS